MSIAKLPIARPVDHGQLVDPQRPIVTMSYRLGPARTPMHRHPRAHLFYCTLGVFRLVRNEAMWMVPATQAIWIPSEFEHSVVASQPIALLSLFVDASATVALPRSCLVVDVSPLLRELILAAIDAGNDYPAEGAAARLMGVLLDRLRTMQPAPLNLPMPQDKRLQPIAQALLANPADDRDLEDWARCAGASVRTLERLFAGETGLGFAAWRRQLRLLGALERLGAGDSVTRVALDFGYQSPSAFIAMFRRTLGVPPSHYFRRTAACGT